MAETTHEMWSCHERVSSSAKQQSLSPHPKLHEGQGGSIPLPQRYNALCVVQRRQKCGAARGHRISALEEGRRKGTAPPREPGCFVTVAVAMS